jgi:hypothetical protein
MRRSFPNIGVALGTCAIGLAAVYLVAAIFVPGRQLPATNSDEIAGPPPVMQTPSVGNFCCEVEYQQEDTEKNELETQAKILDGRDLSMYDVAGFAGCFEDYGCESRSCDKSIESARHFVWDHWRHRKPGYIVVKRYARYSNLYAHIFIEPDRAGRMRVVWKGVEVDDVKQVDIWVVYVIRKVVFKQATNDDGSGFTNGTRYLEFITDGEYNERL